MSPGSDGNIRVVVRPRPGKDIGLVENLDENILVFDPKTAQSQLPGINSVRSKSLEPRKNSTQKFVRSRSQERGVPSRPLQKSRGRVRHKEHKFAFDYVFKPNVTQAEVYEQSTQHLIPKLLEGYNGRDKISFTLVSFYKKKNEFFYTFLSVQHLPTEPLELVKPSPCQARP